MTLTVAEVSICSKYLAAMVGLTNIPAPLFDRYSFPDTTHSPFIHHLPNADPPFSPFQMFFESGSLNTVKYLPLLQDDF